MTSSTVYPKIFIFIWLALLLLLALTALSAYAYLGVWNTIINVAISVIKTLLIALFFMHLRQGKRLFSLFATAGFFWLAILLSLSLSDFLTRAKG